MKAKAKVNRNLKMNTLTLRKLLFNYKRINQIIVPISHLKIMLQGLSMQ